MNKEILQFLGALILAFLLVLSASFLFFYAYKNPLDVPFQKVYIISEAKQKGYVMIQDYKRGDRMAKNLREEFKNGETYYVIDGVIRWVANNQVPPEDILRFFDYLATNEGIGEAFDVVKAEQTRQTDVQAFLAEYRANYQGPTTEEKMEARAAMGEGVEMVNVITGNRWTT